jgi:hypothetical protein
MATTKPLLEIDELRGNEAICPGRHIRVLWGPKAGSCVGCGEEYPINNCIFDY